MQFQSYRNHLRRDSELRIVFGVMAFVCVKYSSEQTTLVSASSVMLTVVSKLQELQSLGLINSGQIVKVKTFLNLFLASRNKNCKDGEKLVYLFSIYK
jgi:hypothetical protein